MASLLPFRAAALAALLVVVTATVGAQDFRLGPELLFPVGDSWSSYWPGGRGQAVELDVPLQGVPMRATGTVEALWLTDRSSRTVILFLGAPGLDAALPLGGWAITAGLDAGGALASLGDFSVSTPALYTAAALGFQVDLAPTLRFGLAAKYQMLWGVLQAVSGWASFTLVGVGD